MDNLPTGTVTFLYTDIEGSTKRWEEHPQQMKAAVERHDEIMREAIAAQGGCVFRTMGDAFCSSFSLAPDALAAALQAQRALNVEVWDEAVSPIKVRMSLHTGIGEVRDGDYVGTPLNRVARLLATGYGGQTLLSQATYDLVRDHLPPGVTVKDLGEHRLKDLERPERVYEAVASDLPSSFPPLKSLNNRPNNLPLQRDQLIGREKELAALQRELLRDEVGLVTLTGPGGVGKTRLSLQAAAELIDDFEHGVFFVPLSTIKDPDLLPVTIGGALGVKEAPNQSVLDTLKDHLRDKEVLLVLDNFEQVVDAAPLVTELMSGAPRLKVLVTSRESLGLYNERDFPVPPLLLPDPKSLPSLETLTQFEAVRLFIERAMSVKPDFVVTNENAPAVADICHRLDGLPLAIELAAARINILPPAAMLARLKSRLTLLTGGARDRPARQQTLRGALMWSYDLLDSGEQRLFQRVSVFVDGCTLEAIEAVCNPDWDLEVDVLDGVSSLVKKSLLRQIEDEYGGARFSMLETIREYALEQLEKSGEAPTMRRNHALYYVKLIEGVELELLNPSGWMSMQRWLRGFDAEYGNLRAMITWGLQEAGEAEIALRAAWSLFWYYNMTTQYIEEGRKWMDSALARVETEEVRRSPAFAKALFAAAYIAFLQGDYPATRPKAEEAVQRMRGHSEELFLGYALQLLGMVKGFQGEGDPALLEECAAIFRKAGNNWGLGLALFTLGDNYLATGEYTLARTTLEESVAAYRASGDIWGSTLPLTSLGRIAWIEGDYERARELVEEGLDLRRREANNKWMTTISMASLAEVARTEGRYEEAVALSEESLRSFREIGDKSGEAWALYNLGLVSYYEGDMIRAGTLLKEALTLRREQGNKEGIALSLAGLAQVASATGRYERAARLFGAANALFDEQVARLSPADKAIYERDRESTLSQLGEGPFQALYAEGRAIGIAGAVESALR